MSSRIGSVLLVIFFVAVIISWYQGLRLYPYALNRYAPESQPSLPKRKIELASVSKIKNLKLEFSLFDDLLYRSLRLREISIPDAASIKSGKANPFAGTGKTQSKAKSADSVAETKIIENKTAETKTAENETGENKIIQP